MTMSEIQLSVAVPVFNEAEIIEDTLTELQQVLLKFLPNESFEILIVDDGSTDRTSEIVEQIAAFGMNVRVLQHPRNLGRGAAVRTAMANFYGDVLVVMDADLSYAATTLVDLATPIMNGAAALTLASPYSKGGQVENVPFIRALVSRLGNLFLRSAFQSQRPTSTSMVRGYSRDLVESLNLLSYGKELNLEILYKAELLGFRVIEVPSKLVWPEARKLRERQKGTKSLTTLGPVIRSHLMFQLLARPVILFGLPIIVSTTISLSGTCLLLWSFLSRVRMGIEDPLRQTLIDGYLTFAMSGFFSIMALLFTVIFFLVVQGKLYFEELFVTLTRISRKFKE
jgi:dolichol-phosphate mannosyltransferase